MRFRTFAAFSIAFALLFGLFSVSACQSGVLSADKGKNVVRLALGADPKTLDPHKAGDVVSSRQNGLVYEQLFEYDYFERPAKIVPALAAEMPVITDEGKTYTIKVRDDVYFQDNVCFPDGKGRKFVASDVVYSIKRFASLSDTPGWWIANGKIQGLNAFRGFATSATAGISDPELKVATLSKALKREVSGLSADDEKGIVTIRLTKRDQQYIAANCMSYFAIVPHEAVDYYGDTFFMNPVGTGPYRLRHWKFKNELVWERNPTFRKQTYPEVPADHKAVDGAVAAEHYKPYVGKTLPLADEIRFRVITESQASWLEFLSGSLDVSGIDGDQFASAIQNDDVSPEMAKKGITLTKYDRPLIEYLVFNMQDPYWGAPGGEKAKALRKAVASSLNRDYYIKHVLNGRGKLANMLVSPQFVGYSKDYTYPWAVYDPAKARQILADAGFEIRSLGDDKYEAIDPETGEVPKITFSIRGTTGNSVKMAKQLKFSGPRVGINIEAEMMQFPEFLKRQREGQGQAYNAGWVFDYPDAQNIMVLLHGDNAVPSGVNAARYKSEAFDKLYDEMNVLDQSIPEQAKEKERLILEMHKVLEEDCPWALIYFGKTYRLAHSWSTPPMPNDFAYNLLKYQGADSEARATKSAEWRTTPIWPALIMAFFGLLFGGLFVFKVLLQP